MVVWEVVWEAMVVWEVVWEEWEVMEVWVSLEVWEVMVVWAVWMQWQENVALQRRSGEARTRRWMVCTSSMARRSAPCCPGGATVPVSTSSTKQTGTMVQSTALLTPCTHSHNVMPRTLVMVKCLLIWVLVDLDVWVAWGDLNVDLEVVWAVMVDLEVIWMVMVDLEARVAWVAMRVLKVA